MLKCLATHLLVALFVTLLFAIVGGILVGFILRAIGSLQGKSSMRYFKLILYVVKGQLISKCLFDVFKSHKKPTIQT